MQKLITKSTNPAFILHNQFLDPKDTEIQKRDRFQKIIMISNGRVELLAPYSFDK